jgi:hypothetical protein
MVRQSQAFILNVFVGQKLVGPLVDGFPVSFRLDMGENIYFHDNLLALATGLWPIS